MAAAYQMAYNLGSNDRNIDVNSKVKSSEQTDKDELNDNQLVFQFYPVGFEKHVMSYISSLLESRVMDTMPAPEPVLYA